MTITNPSLASSSVCEATNEILLTQNNSSHELDLNASIAFQKDELENDIQGLIIALKDFKPIVPIDYPFHLEQHTKLLFSNAINSRVEGYIAHLIKDDEGVAKLSRPTIKLNDADIYNKSSKELVSTYDTKNHEFHITPCSFKSDIDATADNVMGSEVILLDFDGTKNGGKTSIDIIASVEKLIRGLGVFPSAVHTSGSVSNGVPHIHLYYKFDRHIAGQDFEKLIKYRKDLAIAVDADKSFGDKAHKIRMLGSTNFKNGNQKSCLPLSNHSFDDLGCKIIKFEDFCKRADDFLKDYPIPNVDRYKDNKNNSKEDYSEDYVAHVIKYLDINTISYDEWFKFGAGLHNWDKGGPLGLQMFLELSRKDGRYKTNSTDFNDDKVREQYEKYNNDKDDLITFAYLDNEFTKQKNLLLDDHIALPIDKQRDTERLTKLRQLFRVTTKKDIDLIIKERREFNLLNDESKKIFGLTDIKYEGDVDAPALLNEIEKFILDRMVLPPDASIIITLWILQTYFMDWIYTFGYLGINSPEKQCGKSLILKLLRAFVKNGYQTTQISAPTLYRFIEEYKVTLLIDEFDSLKSDKDMANALNAGYERGNSALKTNMDKGGAIEKYDPFCAKVLCGINLTDKIPDSTISRTIIINLKRKYTNDIKSRFRSSANLNPEHPEYKYLEKIRCKLLKIAEDNKDEFKRIVDNFDANYCDDFFKDFEAVSDRVRDNYEHLVILAKLVGGGWYDKLKEAFKSYSKVEFNNKTDHERLLFDIYKIIEHSFSGKESVGTTELLDKLLKMSESGWNEYKFGKPLNLTTLANLLRPYHIKSERISRNPDKQGYKLEKLKDTFDRYCTHITTEDINAVSFDGDDPTPPFPDKPKEILTEDNNIEENSSNLEPQNIDANISNINQLEPKSNELNYEVQDRYTLSTTVSNWDKYITYGIDIETTGLNARDSQIALLQIYNPALDKVFIYKVFDEPLTEKEKQLLSEVRFVAHNSSFERSFMPYLKNLDCSMIAYHASTSSKRCGLSDLSFDTGITYNNKKVMQTSDWSGELTEEQLEYAAKDAKATYLLWEKYKDKNKSVYDRMYKASFIIDDYSKRGLPVDVEALKQLRIDTESRRDEALQKLIDLGFEEIITLAKNITTKKELMAKVTPDVMKIVEEVRSTNSLINNMISGVEDNIVDGRLPINALICGTETGRLATVKPNVQNFPRSGFRHIFKARDGYRFVRADFSGQELRMVAAMSNEKVLLDAFNDGNDPHVIMAARLNNLSIEEFTKKPTDWQKYERQKAKAANFGFLYGMGVNKFIITAKDNYNVVLTIGEATKIKNKFWDNYRILKRWSEKERIECKARGYALTLGGRKRFFEDMDKAYCEMINTTVQGSCGEVLLETLLALPDDLKGYLVNTVHDELIFEIPEHLVEDVVKYNELKDEITNAMITGVKKIVPNYPILNITDISVSERWG